LPNGLTTQPVYTLSRTTGEAVGTYPITVSYNKDDNPNYDITVEPGNLTITPSLDLLV